MNLLYVYKFCNCYKNNTVGPTRVKYVSAVTVEIKYAGPVAHIVGVFGDQNPPRNVSCTKIVFCYRIAVAFHTKYRLHFLNVLRCLRFSAPI